MAVDHIESPVALFIYNRPELTREMFKRVASARPHRLLIVADGAKNEQDDRLCSESREMVSEIRWNCDVDTLYADVNMGCGARISSGLDWVFSHVDEAIILEDDCIPHETFFSFCSELLDRYRDEPEVMCINGTNFQSGIRRTPFSYHFSRYCSSWGWATWARAWRLYDYRLNSWPEFAASDDFSELFEYKKEELFWRNLLDKMYLTPEDVNTWDHQWNYCCWKNGGLAIEPEINMVENRGFGSEDSTHTNSSRSDWVPVLNSYGIPTLTHPGEISRCLEADSHIFNVVIETSRPSGLQRFLQKLWKMPGRSRNSGSCIPFVGSD